VRSLRGTFFPLPLFAGSSSWLRQNAPRGTIVFHAQWDEFPQLFFWNRNNAYIIGLDPTFLYLANPGRYWQWRHISDDEFATCEREHCPDNLSPQERGQTLLAAIKRDFGASYVLLEKRRNPRINAILHRSTSAFEKVYEDESVTLYRVL
jgi:hypothetical protein